MAKRMESVQKNALCEICGSKMELSTQKNMNNLWKVHGGIFTLLVFIAGLAEVIDNEWSTFVYIVLVALSTIALISLFVGMRSLMKKSKFICQNCGHQVELLKGTKL